MTVDEAIEAGWPEDEARDYVLGREKAAAILAAIPESAREPEAETADEPTGEMERRALEVAAELTAKANAAHAATVAGNAAQSALTGARVAVVDRPGEGITPEKQRALALAEARQRRPVIMRPHDGNADADYVLALGDGRVVITRQPVPPIGRVIRPGEWGSYERAEADRQRADENELLVDVFGAERCQRAGIL